MSALFFPTQTLWLNDIYTVSTLMNISSWGFNYSQSQFSQLRSDFIFQLSIKVYVNRLKLRLLLMDITVIMLAYTYTSSLFVHTTCATLSKYVHKNTIQLLAPLRQIFCKYQLILFSSRRSQKRACQLALVWSLSVSASNCIEQKYKYRTCAVKYI